MTAAGDKKGKKILVLGQGDLDVELARIICESGYTGPPIAKPTPRTP